MHICAISTGMYVYQTLTITCVAITDTTAMDHKLLMHNTQLHRHIYDLKSPLQLNVSLSTT